MIRERRARAIIDELIEQLRSVPRKDPAERADADVVSNRALRIYTATRDRRLLEALVKHFSLIPETIARRYAPYDADVRQVAYQALFKALTRFDLSRGVPFPGFAVVTVSGEVKRHFRDFGWSMKISREYKEILEKIKHLAEEDSGLSLSEMAQRIGVSEKRLKEAILAGRAANTVSLFAPVDPDGKFTVIDTVPDLEPGLEAVDNRETVRALFSLLDERSQRILYMRFYLGMTQVKIAAEIGVTQMHVSRLIQKALVILRENYGL